MMKIFLEKWGTNEANENEKQLTSNEIPREQDSEIGGSVQNEKHKEYRFAGEKGQTKEFVGGFVNHGNHPKRKTRGKHQTYSTKAHFLKSKPLNWWGQDRSAICWVWRSAPWLWSLSKLHKQKVAERNNKLV